MGSLCLPSLPGLQSDCEEEIRLLMKEIDIEFQRKYSDLLDDRARLHSLSRAQRDEIENLRHLLMSNNEVSRDNKLKELVKEYSNEIEKLKKEVSQDHKVKDLLKEYSTEIEKLKKENNELKTENYSLQKRVQKLPGNENQLNNLKRTLDYKQDENKILKEQLTKVNEQVKCLENNYQKVVNALTACKQNRDGNDPSQNKVDDDSPSNFVESQIFQTTEKFLLEEAEFCNDFQFKMNQVIDNLKTRLKHEIT